MPNLSKHLSPVVSFTTAYTAGDIECGLHSGIPICCIAFYLTEWKEIQKDRNRVRDHDINSLNYPGYVRCYSCIERNHKVEVRNCQEKDHPYRSKLFKEITHSKEIIRTTRCRGAA